MSLSQFTLRGLRIFRAAPPSVKTNRKLFSSAENEKKYIVFWFYFRYKLVVVGGGTGGCATAAKFARKLGKGQVAVVEPSDVSPNPFEVVTH